MFMTTSLSFLSPLVTTVCLPSDSYSPPNALVAGWGQTSQEKQGELERKLQFAYVQTYSVEVCQAKYSNWLAGIAKVVITQDMICAGNTATDTCAGESACLAPCGNTHACRGQWRPNVAPGQGLQVDS